MTTLYIDVTQTYVSRLATGIQRVVRRVTEELLRQQISGIERVCPVVAMNGRFLLLDDTAIDALLNAQAPAGHASSSGSAARLMARLGAHLPILMDQMQRRRFAQAAKRAIDRPLRVAGIAAGDVVLLLDAFWGGSESLAASRAAGRQGATIVATIYDLIPITHKGYMTPVAAKLFARRLRQALSICDGFIAISRTTASELSRFAGDSPIRTDIAYCGADIAVPRPPASRSDDGIADDVISVPTTESFAYISVSTLEPRKGHGVILDAFERLWADGSHARLTFVGRRGWGVDALWARCRVLEARNPLFTLVDGADDGRLADLLAHSSAAIVASKTEGFGLPVVEALTRDIPVIASDIPVFREIGNDAIAFFAEGDPEALAAMIRTFERDPAPMLAAARRFQWPTWHDAARGYAEAALRLHALRQTDIGGERSA